MKGKLWLIDPTGFCRHTCTPLPPSLSLTNTLTSFLNCHGRLSWMKRAPSSLCAALHPISRPRLSKAPPDSRPSSSQQPLNSQCLSTPSRTNTEQQEQHTHTHTHTHTHPGTQTQAHAQKHTHARTHTHTHTHPGTQTQAHAKKHTHARTHTHTHTHTNTHTHTHVLPPPSFSFAHQGLRYGARSCVGTLPKRLRTDASNGAN